MPTVVVGIGVAARQCLHFFSSGERTAADRHPGTCRQVRCGRTCDGGAGSGGHGLVHRPTDGPGSGRRAVRQGPVRRPGGAAPAPLDGRVGDDGRRGPDGPGGRGRAVRRSEGRRGGGPGRARASAHRRATQRARHATQIDVTSIGEAVGEAHGRNCVIRTEQWRSPGRTERRPTAVPDPFRTLFRGPGHSFPRFISAGTGPALRVTRAGFFTRSCRSDREPITCQRLDLAVLRRPPRPGDSAPSRIHGRRVTSGPGPGETGRKCRGNGAARPEDRTFDAEMRLLRRQCPVIPAAVSAARITLDRSADRHLPSSSGQERQRQAPARWPATLLRGGVLRVTTGPPRTRGRQARTLPSGTSCRTGS